MLFKALGSPHVQAPGGTPLVMRRVVYALLPGVAAYVWFFSWGVVINILLGALVALAAETLILMARRRPVRPFVTDGSAVVTAMLLAMAMPPLSPWWLTVTGVLFAIVIAKHLYGGLGYNPFNPAMVGYVVLLISFPLEMTAWLPPRALSGFEITFYESFLAIFTGSLGTGLSVDAVTMASPLDTLKTELALARTVDEIIVSPTFGSFGGKGWEWYDMALLAGGVWLIYKRVISWHIPVAMLGALFLIAFAFHVYDAGRFAPPLFHIFSGAAVLGAFFIATDPVSAATTERGRLIYGAGIGVLTYVIRTWGGYPDGVAFAVLLMNMAAPTLDYYTQPRVFGQRRG
jgi:Na+-translocating ferredoxin:NAD+ oxidoreductase subunit D